MSPAPEIDTAAIARLNKIIREARQAVEVIRAGRSPAIKFNKIKELAEGYPT